MALLDKTSNLSPKATKTGRGRSGDSKLLNQSTSIPKESPIGNPNSNKLSQSTLVERNSPVGNPNSSKLSQSTLVERNSPVGNPNSNKLSQSVIVEKNSPLNNPISSKISQTQNAFFNVGKSNQFARGGMVETFTGIRAFGANAPIPPPPPLSTYDAFVARTTTAGATQENLAQISSSFLPNIESQTL